MSMQHADSGKVLHRPQWARLCALACMATCSWACSDGTEDEADIDEPLVEASAWTAVADTDDPFSAMRPADAVCDSLGYAMEDWEGEQAFFVDTGACDYLTVEQPALTSVAVGDTLHLRLYHYALTATEPASAELAIVFGQDTAWASSIDIPAEAQLIDTSWKAERAHEAGAPILFHVRNHGDNNYALIELSKLR